MIYALLGLVIGIILGIFAPLQIPVEFARYTAVGIMGILDTIFGGMAANLKGEYNPTIFISGLLFNMFLAIIITYLGDRLSIDLYLAVIVVFTLRIFNNIATIRYSFLTRFLGKKQVEQKIAEK